MLLMHGVTFAQNNVYEFKINYPKDKTNLIPNYMDNKTQLGQIEWFIKNASQKGDSIIIWSYASPEGTLKRNERLSGERGETAKTYLQSLFTNKELANNIIIVNSTPENWEGLRQLVETEYARDDKDEVLAILD